MVDIGDYRGNNDSGVLSHSDMGKGIEDGSINFPKPDSDTGALAGLNRVRGSPYTANAIQIQEALPDYFNSEQG